ncbi:MAG: single-stranded-DNA-specific exonuclease [Rhodospirillaceae bacterium]|nr:single-stranded-DNA-specific exonuclease [Rhodospirillaceae bacterium]
MTTPAFLGIERSLTGRRWRSRGSDERAGLAIAQRLALPEIVGRLLAGRGVGPEAAESFLNPTLREMLPDPSRFRDMDTAAERLARAVMDGEGIAVFGDYDVDGATSSALLARFFAAAGRPIRIYIPDRMKEGYGPNLPALLGLQREGMRIVVTVDCGVTAFEPLAAAAEAGLEVIVVDHHVAEPRLPQAVAVVNPNRLDETAGHGELAAVGVAFLLAVAVNRVLRRAGWYGGARAEPDLKQWLDLVALGTICDVVPLKGLNRALVAQGLKVMGGRGNIGLAALADVARLSEAAGAYHCGFLLGPRVNAGGRVGAADLGARLLSTSDPVEAAAIAQRLDGYNTERRQIEEGVLAEAIAQVEIKLAPGLVFVASAGWHPGVIGIVAGRLKERYGRPACVVALAEGIGKGSGRSVAGLDLGQAVIAARQAGLLINGGGHVMAAGFTVDAGKVDALHDFLSERLGAALNGERPQPTLDVDAALQPGAATPGFVSQVERLGPFGSGNSEPRFALTAARVVRAAPAGEAHVRCVIVGSDGGRLKGIAFRSLEGELGRALLQPSGPALHLAGHLRADRWQGRNEVQFLIDDAAVA